MKMRRRFLQVGDRRVHYRRAGGGPPCVLVHSSPADARLLMGEIEHLASSWTVFAFDTPGFGLSDPLPLREMHVADLADALAQTFAALAMPPCPIYGTHTGAAIALEFGVRYPDLVTGLVLDGVPVFSDAECAATFGDYFRKLPISDLGGHYAETWTRFRDQAIWFPWCERTAANLNGYDLPPPLSTDRWVSMYFEAADTYEPAYRAASFYGKRAVAAAAELTCPAVYCALSTDMLYPHLAWLPPMKPGQMIIDVDASEMKRRDLIADSFVRFGSAGVAPDDPPALTSSSPVERQFVDGATGQVHLRFAGDRAAPPLLLLHDAPGSAEQAHAQIAALASTFFVIAPDLPGHGHSDALAGAPSIEAFAREAITALGLLGVDSAVIYGIGFGSSVALVMAEMAPDLVLGIALEGVLLPPPALGEELADRFAPKIEVNADGSHWYRTWLMLRDSQIYWPWYDHRERALRRMPGVPCARRLHRWTLDVMRGRASYAALIHAALAHDAEGALLHASSALVLISGGASPLAAFDVRAESARPDALHLTAGSDDVPTLIAMTFAHTGETNRVF
ncbi:alpha/beta fold hydrolase [Sphingomonas sp.]|uniref:alpha/beta fold hydrolase n=1 Tax=Sphingomonas sp. TaxID=28214 RepID=UPI003CC61B56